VEAVTVPDRRVVVTAFGVAQILAWGSSFYLLGVLAGPIVRDRPGYEWITAGVSAGLLVAGITELTFHASTPPARKRRKALSMCPARNATCVSGRSR
jgi:hypothetical protein